MIENGNVVTMMTKACPLTGHPMARLDAQLYYCGRCGGLLKYANNGTSKFTAPAWALTFAAVRHPIRYLRLTRGGRRAGF